MSAASPEGESPDPQPGRGSQGGPAPLNRSRGNMRLAGLGMELAGALVGGCLLGYWIDRRFGTFPWWFLICTGIALVGGLYNLIRQAVQYTSASPPRERREGPEARERQQRHDPPPQ